MVFSIIGGDERMLFLAERLIDSGHKVRLCGFENHERHVPSVSAGDALFGADCVILPLPSSKDGKTVWMPYSEQKLYLADMASAAGRKTLFLTANAVVGAEREKDYFAREELTVLNAVPTVEGALQVALNNTDRTIWRSNCLIAGFGRIGKLLCHRLSSFGCKISATSRRPETESWIEAYGYTCVNQSTIAEKISEYDIIFNTVPENIFTEEILTKVRDDCILIELASAPYGIDFSAAKRLGKQVILASGLPAKTAPKTAADIIFDTISNILSEQF